MFCKGLLVVVALVGLGTARLVIAQPAATPDYATFCTGEAGFGLRFGEPAPAGLTSTVNSVIVPIDPRFAPFADAEVAVSYWTRKVHAVTAEVRLGDPASVAALAVAIRRAYEARGWTIRPGLGEEAFAIYSVPPNPDSRSNRGIRLSVSPFRGMLTLSCENLASQRAVIAEALEGPPAGIGRPRPPTLPTLAAVAAAQCEDPALAMAVAGRPQTVVDPITSYGSELIRYQQQLAAWKAAAIVRAGRWTRAQEAQFAAGLLRDPAIGTSLQRGSAMIMEMLALVTGEPANPREACLQAVRLEALMRRVVTHAEAQSRLIEAAYDAQARRLGVSLE